MLLVNDPLACCEMAETKNNITNPFPLEPDLVAPVLDWIEQRIAQGSDPMHGAKTLSELAPQLKNAINQEGIGSTAAFELFTDVIVPSARPFDHPTSLSFVASAATPASLAFDAALGPAEIFAGNWDGGSGAVHAENQALAWLAGLAGWPKTSGGVFVAGGTIGNLSALHAARTKREADLGGRPARWALVASKEAHSSIAAAARVMDVDLILVESDDLGQMSAEALRATVTNPEEVFAVVANAGATNSGAVDDLAGIAEFCNQHGIWMHVDGAYGLAALASPLQRPKFDGIEQAHSFIVDPHKWLFAPYDCCALVYREPEYAAAAHAQRAEYLEAIDKAAWNPSDFAIHLTLRARGLPLWFSLASYGTHAYEQAIDAVIQITDEIAKGIDQSAHLALIMPPQLSVILFQSVGKSLEEMQLWAEQLRRSGALLCLPTFWRSEPVFRICLVNPATDPKQVLSILESLAD